VVGAENANFMIWEMRLITSSLIGPMPTTQGCPLAVKLIISEFWARYFYEKKEMDDSYWLVFHSLEAPARVTPIGRRLFILIFFIAFLKAPVL
jgi:hypothetical protein